MGIYFILVVNIEQRWHAIDMRCQEEMMNEHRHTKKEIFINNIKKKTL